MLKMVHCITRTCGYLFMSLTATVFAESVTVQVFNNNHQPVADAAVYIEAPENIMAPVSRDVQIEQKHKRFNPFVSVVAAGTTAYFPNKDGIGHHVYSFSKARTFQLPLSEQESSESVQFDQPGIITVGCNIHDWMVAYIYVVDTPYYAVTGTDGHVDISGLAPGQYTVHVWHPGIDNNTDREQTLSVAQGQTAQLEFTIGIKPSYLWKPEPPDGDGEQY